MRCRFWLGMAVCGLLSLAPVQGAERNTGPWDLEALAAPPKITWADETGSVRGLYYTGEEYEGKPTRVFAWYAVPEGRKDNEKLPAMVLVHGGGGTAFKEWAELWTKRGYVAIAMDLAGCGPDRVRLPDGGPGQTDQEKFLDIAGGVKKAWTYHAVANVIRAVSLIRTQEEVDPGRVGITGISWGGYLTCIVAGLDQRLQGAVPVYGCGFLHEESAWVERIAKMPEADRDLWIKTFDPSQYLPGCEIPILFVNGTNDFAYPLNSYQKSYRLVKGPRQLCVTVRMPHGHPQGWAPVEIGLFMDALLIKGKPLAQIGPPTRDDKNVTAKVESATPLKSAELHVTRDTGLWTKRNWETLPATINNGQITATLPADKGIVYFLTVKDDRGAVVSTEHEEVE